MYANVVDNANCSKIHGGLMCKKHKFGTHFCVQIGAVETKTRKPKCAEV